MSDTPAVIPIFPSSGEDWSILRWWRHHPRRGLLWIEVAIGHVGPGEWPNPRSHRRIDAVHVPDHPEARMRYWDNDHQAFAQALHSRMVEVVEAKKELNVSVIGQCIAGVDMLTRAYPDHGPIRPIAVVRGTPDPALRWVCHRRGIDVDAIGANEFHAYRQSAPGLQPHEQW